MRFRITITGTAPLLMHNGRLANPLDPSTQALKSLTSKRKKTDDDLFDIARAEFLGGLYIDPDVGPYVPGENVSTNVPSTGGFASEPGRTSVTVSVFSS